MNNVFYHVVQFGEWEPSTTVASTLSSRPSSISSPCNRRPPDDEFAVIQYSQTIAYTTREGDLE